MDRRFALKNLTLSGMGLALSPALLSALQSCTPGYDPGYALQALTAKQDQLLAQLVELIIPTTDTPGARAAGVHHYIDRVLAQVKAPEMVRAFCAMLDRLQDDGFLAQRTEAQVETLQQMEQATAPDERAFFGQLKSMTIHGYYTSKIGASEELKYVHATGFYNGEMDYSEVGRNFY